MGVVAEVVRAWVDDEEKIEKKRVAAGRGVVAC